MYIILYKYSWCNSYCCKKWMLYREFKSSMSLFTPHITLIHFGKVTNPIILLQDMHIYPTPPLGQDMTRGQFLSGL